MSHQWEQAVIASVRVTIEGLWCWLWPFGCVAQWHKCWMLRIWLLSWGSCHDNCTAGWECPVPELLRRARIHRQSQWLWNIAGTRDPSLYFCQCLLSFTVCEMCKWSWQVSGKGKKKLISLKDFCITLISWLYQIQTFTSEFHVGMQC